MPPRRGVRLSRVPHPAAPQEGHEQDGGLHLPIEEGVAFYPGEGAGVDQESTSSRPADLLGRLNPVLRGWCAYFRHGVSKATFGYLDAFVWHRVTRWLLKRHKRITWAELFRRFLTARPGNRPQENGIVVFDAATVPISRYRWRGTSIPTPWTSTAAASVPA
ncbi:MULTISPECIES: group II intron maturase-specific domain-containing protein [unclassified Mycolicibacterium]|uniref:group II intron maturase-specific domain-containing protein n=1 Tax=unclassified Mycolicibacterium TaxID=2636767 RepID=UPI002ED8A1B7